mmetsp:Transcript_29382/g.63727  ORF Transcript_29382/g.63727 Transcript_29382/m.63727 type:complete len:394 (-) Transcript_29382:591-1772(-)|eukprot:CAMPEP_0206480490 /NCGR_PEP_ID=MMETSP0324_2-20121206/37370_1 /ASSEMBLY_ACC=CAM_ASM_000836 /TAXON_ID=2866 /ORGANISM="Crypthecodinium cohnii, Strain Seligo" /LENGTH=393 /DNA_ID=CAMNT_0053957377 /DNA_START=114 /DNA_END=1295 /DNA_ORIENTATION=-
MGTAAEDELAGLLSAGQSHLERSEWVKAMKTFTAAVELSDHAEVAVVGKVQALRELRRPRGALKACDQGLKREPKSEYLLKALQELTEELGEAETQAILDEVPLPDDASTISPPLDASSVPRNISIASSSSSPREGHNASAAEGLQRGDEPCPSAKSQQQATKESSKIQLRRSIRLEVELGSRINTEESAQFRAARKEELTSFYRVFYAETKPEEPEGVPVSKKSNLDTSQYGKEEKSGLSIKDGHRPLPRPDHVELPHDHKQSVGTLTAEQLKSYGCDHPDGRFLLSIHGDLFDVSDRPDKYGPDGPYYSMSGRDITWALWSGYDDENEWDKYYDLMQCKPLEERDRRFQGLMSWWAFFEQEYGEPVGRLEVYDREWELPPPPVVQDLCVIM